MVNQEAVLKKLEVETRNKNLEWSPNEMRINNISEEVLLGKAYNCPFGDDYLRVYRFEYRYCTDSDEFTWMEEIRLELIDSIGYQKWEFSKNRKIWDIYNLAQYHAENIDSIFGDFLDQ